jgi:hypothetical protein
MAFLSEENAVCLELPVILKYSAELRNGFLGIVVAKSLLPILIR